MNSSQSSNEFANVFSCKRKRSNWISDADSEVGTTHLRMLTVDQLEDNDVAFIQDDADEDKDDSKSRSNF